MFEQEKQTSSALQPVFVVGSGRSGTTILYKLLVGHADLAWISNLTDLYPQFPQLSILSRIPGRRRFPHLWPSAEAIQVYEYCGVMEKLRQKRESLVESDVTGEARSRLQFVVRSHMRWMGRRRFINKNTENTMRIRYLKEVFPGARFIHIIRNGFAVANSLNKVDWWPDLNLWWLGKTPRQWAEEGGDPLALCAMHWKKQVREILTHKDYLPAGQYLEIRYERLMDDPWRVLKEILAFCRLEWTAQFERAVNRIGLRPGNKDKWMELMDRDAIAVIRQSAGDLLSELGYQT